MNTENFIRADNIGQSLSGAPALNVYSKFTYQNVEYSLSGSAFLFCRGASCSNKTRLGLSSNIEATPSVAYTDRYNGRQFIHSSGWSESTYSPVSVTLSPSNPILEAAIGGTAEFDLEWIA